MTIEDRADGVALEFIQENEIRIATDGPKCRALVTALVGLAKEVARDQRQVCAESVMAVVGDNNNPWMIDKDAAHQAVMNAEIR